MISGLFRAWLTDWSIAMRSAISLRCERRPVELLPGDGGRHQGVVPQRSEHRGRGIQASSPSSGHWRSCRARHEGRGSSSTPSGSPPHIPAARCRSRSSGPNRGRRRCPPSAREPSWGRRDSPRLHGRGHGGRLVPDRGRELHRALPHPALDQVRPHPATRSPDRVAFDAPLLREELAAGLGATREHVERTLFRSAGAGSQDRR